MIAELTDESNVARGFSLMPMARAIGYIIGSVGRVPCCRDVVIDVLRTWVQSFYRRCFIASARSMARPLLAPILGRVSVLSSMLCGRGLCTPVAHIEYTLSKRGNAYGRSTSSRHALIFQKTLDSPPRSDLVHQSSRDTPPKDTEVRESESTDAIVPAKPLPLHMLLTKPVLISISNYAMLALLDM